MLSKSSQEKLIEIARFSIEEYIIEGKVHKPVIDDKELNICYGAFVSLYKEGDLRGCIGRIISDEEPLWEVVRNMAIEACSKDYRFDPISEEEIKLIAKKVPFEARNEKWLPIRNPLHEHSQFLRLYCWFLRNQLSVRIATRTGYSEGTLG